MDVSPPRYGRSCRPSFWNFGRNLATPMQYNSSKGVIDAVDPTHIHLTSQLYICKVFDNLYLMWMCIWMCPHHVTASHADQAWGILLEIWALPANNSWWNAVTEVVEPTHIHLTLMSYMWKEFDNLYMLWMCICMCPHHVMATHAEQADGILLEIWATPSQ